MNNTESHTSASGSLLSRAAVAMAVLAILLGLSRTAAAQPFTQCPAIGFSASCAILITLNADGSVTIATDSGVGAFDGIEDTLVGVQNNTSITIPNLQLSSALPIFGFDGDGICNQSGGPPCGSTGYEGPNTSFTIVDNFNGTVNFIGGLAPGGSAFFGLEEAVTGAVLNIPPNCTAAAASFPTLWPPNHKFFPETITGVISLLPVTINIDGIHQDEPTLQPKSVGAGDTCPDGKGIGTLTAQVRAERAGNVNVPGDGRVYHIDFTATDTNSKSCSGTVLVCVPHDQSGPGSTCVDEVPLFDSTKCP